MTEIVDPTACFRCGYSLQGTPDDGSCPECGLTKRESDRAFAAVRAGINKARLRQVRNGLLLAFVAWIILVPAALVTVIARVPTFVFAATIPLMVHFLAFSSVSDAAHALIARSASAESIGERVLRLTRYLRLAFVFGGLYLLVKLGVPWLVVGASVFVLRMVTFAALDAKLRRMIGGLSAGAETAWWKAVWVATGIGWAAFLAASLSFRITALPPAGVAVGILIVGALDGIAQYLLVRMAWHADRLLAGLATADILRTARKRIPYGSSVNS